VSVHSHIDRHTDNYKSTVASALIGGSSGCSSSRRTVARKPEYKSRFDKYYPQLHNEFVSLTKLALEKYGPQPRVEILQPVLASASDVIHAELLDAFRYAVMEENDSIRDKHLARVYKELYLFVSFMHSRGKYATCIPKIMEQIYDFYTRKMNNYYRRSELQRMWSELNSTYISRPHLTDPDDDGYSRWDIYEMWDDNSDYDDCDPYNYGDDDDRLPKCRNCGDEIDYEIYPGYCGKRCSQDHEYRAMFGSSDTE